MTGSLPQAAKPAPASERHILLCARSRHPVEQLGARGGEPAEQIGLGGGGQGLQKIVELTVARLDVDELWPSP
jgi:hypothetical protein